VLLCYRYCLQHSSRCQQYRYHFFNNYKAAITAISAATITSAPLLVDTALLIARQQPHCIAAQRLSLYSLAVSDGQRSQRSRLCRLQFASAVFIGELAHTEPASVTVCGVHAVQYDNKLKKELMAYTDNVSSSSTLRVLAAINAQQ
jgi:hypothetical protein